MNLGELIRNYRMENNLSQKICVAMWIEQRVYCDA